MLVEHLPEDSAFVASLRGGRQMRAWTTEAYLLAATANQLNVANHQRAGKRTRRPLVEPPKTTKVRKRTVTVAQLLMHTRKTSN